MEVKQSNFVKHLIITVQLYYWYSLHVWYFSGTKITQHFQAGSSKRCRELIEAWTIDDLNLLYEVYLGFSFLSTLVLFSDDSLMCEMNDLKSVPSRVRNLIVDSNGNKREQWSWLEWILQNQVSARRLELNKIIFRQITPTLHDLVVFKEISIQRLKKAKMRMVSPKYGSKPT